MRPLSIDSQYHLNLRSFSDLTYLWRRLNSSCSWGSLFNLYLSNIRDLFLIRFMRLELHHGYIIWKLWTLAIVGQGGHNTWNKRHQKQDSHLLCKKVHSVSLIEWYVFEWNIRNEVPILTMASTVFVTRIFWWFPFIFVNVTYMGQQFFIQEPDHTFLKVFVALNRNLAPKLLNHVTFLSYPNLEVQTLVASTFFQ